MYRKIQCLMSSKGSMLLLAFGGSSGGYILWIKEYGTPIMAFIAATLGVIGGAISIYKSLKK